jgi:hypothetical protein
MTGTPLDLTPFGPLLNALGPLYWLAAALCIALALWWLKPRWLKFGAAAVIAVAFVMPVLRHKQERQAQFDAAKAKRDAARAHFEMHCKSAGEKITRTFENVDGILLLKVPSDIDHSKEADPMYRQAARFSEPSGDWYIRSMLRWPSTRRPPNASSVPDTGGRPAGYEFVDVVDEKTLVRYRYRMVIKQLRPDSPSTGLDLVREAAAGPPPRFGVTFEDVVDPVDRQHWIANDVFTVVDLQTKEVVGERKRYVREPGLGSTAGFRQPWASAGYKGHRCPEESGNLADLTLKFVQKVLIPTKEE